MKRDNIVDPGLPGLSALGVIATAVEKDILRRDFPAS